MLERYSAEMHDCAVRQRSWWWPSGPDSHHHHCTTQIQHKEKYPPAKNIRFGAAWLPFNWIKEEVRRTTSCVLKRPAFLQPLRPSAQSLDCWFIPRLALSHDTMIMKGMGCGGILCIIDCILPDWVICKTDRPLLHLGANYENLTAKLKKIVVHRADFPKSRSLIQQYSICAEFMNFPSIQITKEGKCKKNMDKNRQKKVFLRFWDLLFLPGGGCPRLLL